RSSHQIAGGLGLPIELVESTVSELGEAGLLQSPSSRWDSALNRRRASKLIAAGLLGGVALPVIRSITAPSALAAVSPAECTFVPLFGCTPRGTGVCSIGCALRGYGYGGYCDSVSTGGV